MRADHVGEGPVLVATAAAAAPPRGRADKAWLAAEFIALFLLVPTLAFMQILPRLIIPVLVAGGAVCLVVLLRDRAFDRRQLGIGPDGPPPRGAVRRMIVRFLLGAGAMLAGVALFDQGRLFYLVRTRPEVWAIIMVGYPVLSVYPQEIIFRAFMFHRYKPVFRARWAMIIASAAAFGYAHVVFNSPIAVALSTIGGAIFALTYDRTRSTLFCAIEHALYGCFIFTVGLGVHFYAGTMRFAESAAGAAGW